MKKIMFPILSLIASLGTAQAADVVSRKAAPPPPPAPLWTGAYVGANLGGGWARQGTGGISGGAQIGYNRQITPLFVAGLEADFQATSLSASNRRPFDPAALVSGVSPTFPPGGPGGRNLPWFGTLRGRIGVLPLTPSLLIYGTGGFAYAGGHGGVTTGWTAGGGVEWAFARNWSAKAEYLFADLSPGGSGPFGDRRTNFQLVRAGVNYRFDPGDFLMAGPGF